MKDPLLALLQGLLGCGEQNQVAVSMLGHEPCWVPALEPGNQIFAAAESQAAVDWGQMLPVRFVVL